MAIKHEGIEGRSDLYRINPSYIDVVGGWNPRQSFGDEKDVELKNSIIENGVISPIRVKKNGTRFNLVDGERRFRAVRKAIEEGHLISSIPCLIEKRTQSEVSGFINAIIANDGKPLTPIEEAEAYQKLKNWGLKAEEIAKKVGKSVPAIYSRLKLVNASEKVKEAVNSRTISQKAARKIVEEAETVEEQDVILNTVQESGEGDKRRQKGPRVAKRKSFDIQEIRDLMNNNKEEFETTDDEEYKAFCAGMVRALSIVLGEDEPIEIKF